MLSIAELAHKRDPEAIASIICQEVKTLDIGAIKVEVEITDSNLDIQIRTNNAFDKDKLLTLLRSKLPTLRIKSVSKFRIHCWRNDEDIHEQRLMWTEQFMLDPQYPTIALGQNSLAYFADDSDNHADLVGNASKELRSPEPQLSKNSVLQQAIAQIMPDSVNSSAKHLDPSQPNIPIENQATSNYPFAQSSSITRQPNKVKPTSDQSYWQFLLVGVGIILLGLGIGASVRTITASANLAKDEVAPSAASSQPNSNPPNLNPERPETRPIPPSAGVTSQTPVDDNVITLEKFNLVEKGMTLAQVEKILGMSGSVIAESVSNTTVGKVYSWKNPQGSNAIIEFKDGRVVAKAQAGL